MVTRVQRSLPWIVGLLAVLVAGSAQPQGNIDAGKTPAQMFADICTNCHRRPQELKRGASAGFLRQHYMPGSQEAAAMASYLAGLPSDPRAKDRAKDARESREPREPREKATKAQQQANDKAKALTPKAKRAAELAKTASEPPPEPAPEIAAQPEPEAPPVPKLEPFEE